MLLEREDGLPQLRVTDLRTGACAPHRVPRAGLLGLPGRQRRVRHDAVFRYSYQSLVTPALGLRLRHGRRATSTLLKQQEVLGGYDRAQLRVASGSSRPRRTACSVPISLVYRKGLTRDGQAPALLYGYGSYGFPYPVTFSSNRLTLLDRGVVFAIAHIRGGGELGKPWHDDGRMLKKRNTFTDFIAARRAPDRARSTRAPTALVIEGGSAGGLLMGAVTNLRPDLFKAVVSQVPFVDVINTMLDEIAAADRRRVRGVGQPARRRTSTTT